ncbi:hypothetical protein [Rhodococcus sp. NPDC004095]
MGINMAEDRPEYALVAEMQRLRAEFDEYRTTPQRIGNGSLNYAVFVPFTLGPFTIPSGFTANIGVTFMDHTAPFTYDGKPAINRSTLIEPNYSIAVDVNDSDHLVPYGPALTPQQRMVRDSWRWDYWQSSFTETNGQRYVNIQLTNYDASSHSYWVIGTALIPRPALKPQ